MLEEIIGLEGEIAAEDRQLALIQEEMGDLQQPCNKRLIPKSRLLEWQSRMAEIEGRRSQNVAGILRAHQSIGEARLRITELYTNVVNEAVDQQGRVQDELLDLSERLRAAQDVRTRTEVLAPQTGMPAEVMIVTGSRTSSNIFCGRSPIVCAAR